MTIAIYNFVQSTCWSISKLVSKLTLWMIGSYYVVAVTLWLFQRLAYDEPNLKSTGLKMNAILENPGPSKFISWTMIAGGPTDLWLFAVVSIPRQLNHREFWTEKIGWNRSIINGWWFDRFSYSRRCPQENIEGLLCSSLPCSCILVSNGKFLNFLMDPANTPKTCRRCIEFTLLTKFYKNNCLQKDSEH